MVKLLFFVFLLSCTAVLSQADILVLKRENKSVAKFWKGSVIAFRLESGQWRKGEITKIKEDSFYIRPMEVHYYLMGTDTAHYPVEGYTLADVFILPKKGVLIDYRNGYLQPIADAGHVHWYWIKSGWLFRTFGIGYAGLNVANGIIDNNFSWHESRQTIAICAAVWAFGFALKKLYKPYYAVGKRYFLKNVGANDTAAKIPGKY